MRRLLDRLSAMRNSTSANDHGGLEFDLVRIGVFSAQVSDTLKEPGIKYQALFFTAASKESCHRK